MNASELYISQRALIDRTIASVCRRNHVSKADGDDFSSAVHLHLIDDDYAVLRAYQGRAELGAFLHAVIRRLFQDWRNANWGRWRPSASARREGSVAVLLERLLVRDRLPLGEAIEMLRTNHGVSESPADLEALAATLPPRVMRTFLSTDGLDARVNDSESEFASASIRVDEAEARSAAERVTAALDAAIARLPAQDQAILRMRFEDGAAVSTISRALGLEQQPLYRRVDRLLANVRASLERTGVDADYAREVIRERGFDLLERRPS